jgi:hypothetical protein
MRSNTLFHLVPSCCQENESNFEMATAIIIQYILEYDFRDVAPYSLVEVCQHFRGVCCLHKTSVNFYRTTRRYIPEFGQLHIRGRKKTEISPSKCLFEKKGSKNKACCFRHKITERRVTTPTDWPGFDSWRRWCLKIGNYTRQKNGAKTGVVCFG